jgi:predicted ArsR family transcriptional regulator
MRLNIEQSDAQFLQQMHGLGNCSIQDLCRAAHVTATAVRQRLARLQSQGLVSRQAVRQGRGRPHHAYVVTNAGLKLLGDNYAELALLLWNEIKRIEQADVREAILKRLQDVLSRRYGAQITGGSVLERMDQLKTALNERGFHVELDNRDGLPVLRENNCPYHDLAAVDEGICGLEINVFEKVLGAPLVLAQCCRDGHASCEFHVRQSPKTAAVAVSSN